MSVFFSEEDLLKTKALRNIEQYHLAFQKFLTISIYLEHSLNTFTEFYICCNDKLIEFCVEKCKDCDDFKEMKAAIKDITINRDCAFVYQRIMDFHEGVLITKH